MNIKKYRVLNDQEEKTLDALKTKSMDNSLPKEAKEPMVKIRPDVRYFLSTFFFAPGVMLMCYSIATFVLTFVGYWPLWTFALTSLVGGIFMAISCVMTGSGLICSECKIVLPNNAQFCNICGRPSSMDSKWES